MRVRAILFMAVVMAALGVVFFIANRPEPEAGAQTQPLVWSVGMDDIKAISISLPAEGKSEAWLKRGNRDWYFNRPDGPKVNARRWGGIPLLLSGAKAERLIATNATADKLAVYGFTDPRMVIDLVLENEDTIRIAVGDGTPDGNAVYVRLIDSTEVYSVHHTWFEVIERLVLDPPYTKGSDY